MERGLGTSSHSSASPLGAFILERGRRWGVPLGCCAEFERLPEPNLLPICCPPDMLRQENNPDSLEKLNQSRRDNGLGGRSMDDRRFDALTRSLASGQNRRTLLKGLFGLGGAVASSTLVSGAKAARRPPPTPKPLSCPGQQTAVGGQCICEVPRAPGTQKCGPDCCNPAGIGAAHSECCDNACCYGACYGEELCCPYPRAFCPITGECCPEGWTCCPDYGCISPEQCCTAENCPLQDCLAAVCPADHFCAYVDNCLSGGAACCEAPICSRSDCLPDGNCADPVPDCRNGGPDGADCCGDLTCNPNNGECCQPLTCASVPAHTCPSNFPDGCGGVLDCSGVCDERLTCLGGGCANTSTTCYTSYCADSVLGACNQGSGGGGVCINRLNGSLQCVSGVYSTTGQCGDCTSDADCLDPGDFCSPNASTICGTCPSGQGDGCGIPIT